MNPQVVIAPLGFAITRREPEENPYDIVEYEFTVTTRLKQSISLEMDAIEDYREMFLEDAVKRFARAVMEQCQEVLT